VVLAYLRSSHTIESKRGISVLVDEPHLNILQHFFSASSAEMEVLLSLEEEHHIFSIV